MKTQKQIEKEFHALMEKLLQDVGARDAVELSQAVGKAIAMLVALHDGLVGAQETGSLLLAIGKHMATGEPQKRVKVHLLDRSKAH